MTSATIQADIAASATIQADVTASATLQADVTATTTFVKTDARIPVEIVTDGVLRPDATFTGPAGRTRFDADGVMQTVAENESRTTYIGGIPLLLMEGERENLCLQSEALGVSPWIIRDGTEAASIVSDQAVAPDGETTADELVENSAAASEHYIRQDETITNGVDYTWSVFAKKNTRSWIVLIFRAGFGGGEVFFDLDTGAVGTEGFGATGNIKSVGNGWYKCSITKTSTGTGGQFSIGLASGDNVKSYDGDGASSAYLWGAQLEEGVHESSYIKTTTAAVTRTTEAASLTNSIISSLTEGTIYAEVYSEHLTSDAARHIAELESDASNFIRVQHSADGDLDAQITTGGVSQATLAGTDLTVDTLEKVALVFGPSGFALYRGGTQIDTGTGTVPSVDTLLIGAGLYGGLKTLNIEVSERSQASAEALTT